MPSRRERSVEVRTDGGGRADTTLTTGGGFQRGTVVDAELASGMFCVALDGCNRRRWACATEIVILGMEHHLPTQYSCAAGELVAIRSVHSDIDDVNSELPRWLPAAQCTSETPLHGTGMQRFQRVQQQTGLNVTVARKDGRFGIRHDEHNRIIAIQPNSAAETSGLRVGDVVRAIDGIELDGLLGAALQGKESVELEVDAMESEVDMEWLIDYKRFRVPALSLRGASSNPINVGDKCFVLVSTWFRAPILRWHVPPDWGEEFLHPIDGGLHDARLAWRGACVPAHVAPGACDIFVGMHVVMSMHGSTNTYLGGRVVAPADRRNDEKRSWTVRLESGDDVVVPRKMLRARSEAPIRVMALWGDYYVATVADVLADGVIRVDFGSGQHRWVFADQLLQDTPPAYPIENLPCFIACAVDEAGTMYRRAALIREESGGKCCRIRFEGGDEAIVPRTSIRKPWCTGDKVNLKLRQEVIALFGLWRPAVMLPQQGDTHKLQHKRAQVRLTNPSRSCWAAEVSFSEIIGLDTGLKHEELLARELHTGSLVVARTGDADGWVEGVILAFRDGGRVSVVTASGASIQVEPVAMRPREGVAHIMSEVLSFALMRKRQRYDRAVDIMQRAAIRQKKKAATTKIQSSVRRYLAALRCKQRKLAATGAAVAALQSESKRAIDQRLAEARERAAARREQEAKQQESIHTTYMATVLQSMARRRRAYLLRVRAVEAAVIIESHCRRKMALQFTTRAQQRTAAATTIQVIVLARRREKGVKRRQWAAVKVQAAMRAKAAQLARRSQDQAAMKLQVVARRCLARAKLKAIRRMDQELHVQASRIQALARGWKARHEHRLVLMSVVVIQARMRRMLARKRAQILLAKLRERERHDAAAELQSYARAKACRSAWKRQRSAATALQVGWQLHRQREQRKADANLAREQQLATNVARAAVLMQAFARRYLARRGSAQESSAAITIQAYARRKFSYCQRLHAAAAVTMIESRWRGHAAREALHERLALEKRNRSVILLQTQTRTALAVRRLRSLRNSKERDEVIFSEVRKRLTLKAQVRAELAHLRLRTAARTGEKNARTAGSSNAPAVTFTVLLRRKDGRFGMGHDEKNRVIVVHAGSAADDSGVRVGDVVHAINGRTLDGLLSAALQGKDIVKLSLMRGVEQALECSDLGQVARAVVDGEAMDIACRRL